MTENYPYAVGLCNPNIEEVAKLSKLCYSIYFVGYKGFLPYDAWDAIANETVVLLGDEWGQDFIASLSKEAQAVRILVKGTLSLHKYSHTNVITDLEKKYPEINRKMLIEEFPWLRHLLRLHKVANNNESMFFHRGFVDFGKENGYENFEDYLLAIFQDYLEIDEQYCTFYGCTVQQREKLVLQRSIATSYYLYIDHYHVCLFFCNQEERFLYLTAAMDVADIGINVRKIAKCSGEKMQHTAEETWITFYTMYPDRVKLTSLSVLRSIKPIFLSNVHCSICLPYWFTTVKEMDTFLSGEC